MGSLRHDLFTESGGDAVPEFRIGLAPIREADWFEPAEPDPAARKDRLRAAPDQPVWRETVGSRPAQQETAAAIAAWMGQHTGRAVAPTPEEPLWSASRWVSDDLCLMEKKDGQWTLTAASLCAASFFSAATAVGKPLVELHAPVPGFETALASRVSRIFDHLPADTLLERRNWTVVNSTDLFQPDPAPYRARVADQTLDQVADSLVVRRERQTIRTLPETGAVLFTIRIWLEPLERLFADPCRRAAFATAWDRLMSPAGEPFRLYKRLDLYDPAVRRRLAQLEAARYTGADHPRTS